MTLNVVRRIDDTVRVQHVLVSVWDKQGLEGWVRSLNQVVPGVKFYSTGGTYEVLKQVLGEEQNGKLVPISAYTGQPEMQGGLVKTLDFKIYLGLLSETYNEAHTRDLARTAAVAFDMVVVNLYPFEQVVSRADVTPEMARTHIDIGGPCMLRAAAKNFLRVAAVSDPLDYEPILEELRKLKGRLSLTTRIRLARKAFATTARYDTAIAAYWAQTPDSTIRACYDCVG